ncbi:MAG: L,D-transpeptidase [Rhizobiaceae bacterium]
MKRTILAACIAAVAATAMLPAATVPAEAGSLFAKVMRGGQQRIEHVAKVSLKNSDASPIARQVVAFGEKVSPGTVIVDTSERRLYYTLGDGLAVKYAVSVARPGFEWSGTNRISRKAEWPGWTPPAEMIAREAVKGHKLPAYMPGGPNNPLGARALYLGTTVYRIHGTNQPWTVDKAMSSGCIRMANEDVVDLYRRVGIGTTVIVR